MPILAFQNVFNGGFLHLYVSVHTWIILLIPQKNPKHLLKTGKIKMSNCYQRFQKISPSDGIQIQKMLAQMIFWLKAGQRELKIFF